MEYVMLAVGLAITVIFLGFLLNKDYWVGYHNSKFIDEVLQDEQELHAGDNTPANT